MLKHTVFHFDLPHSQSFDETNVGFRELIKTYHAVLIDIHLGKNLIGDLVALLEIRS